MKYTLKRIFLIIVPLVLAGLIFRYGSYTRKGARHIYYVKHVIDGDTIVLSNNERVRYIGINTPEISHPRKGIERMAKDATEFNRKLVEHKKIRLEFDIELRDKYGRLLAYVYVDNKFINAELVKAGYARVFTFPPNIKHVARFQSLEREAKKDHRGLWATQ